MSSLSMVLGILLLIGVAFYSAIARKFRVWRMMRRLVRAYNIRVRD